MKKFFSTLFTVYIYLVFVWLMFALSIDAYFIYLHFSGQDAKAQQISNEILIRIDGTYKDNPKNIWYSKP